MLARDGNARRVDDIGLDAARQQPAGQPETVAARLESNRDPGDRSSGLDCLLAPAMQQRQQQHLARFEFLRRMALDARDHAGDQPARLAHLNHRDQRAILIQSGERSAQVVRLRHRAPPSVCFQRRKCRVLAARPIASLIRLLGHEIPVEQGGRDRQRMLAVGGAHTRARRHVSPDAMPAHHPLDPLAADALARGTQFGMNTWCPLSGPGARHEPAGYRSAVRDWRSRAGYPGRDRQAWKAGDADTPSASHRTRTGQTSR